MDDLGDLNDICDIKPFGEIYISTDDDEPMPQITDVYSLRNDALPEASKVKYFRAYHHFKGWQKERNVITVSEPLMMEYFQELAVKQKPTSLWAYFSMLKRTLQMNLNIDISSYDQVLNFLKSNSSGYEPVKSKSFTLEEVVKFVIEAPDDVWLDVKTVCIFGVCGSLKNGELRSIKYGDVEQHGDIILVRVEDANTKAFRSFTIFGEFCGFVKKYLALRPSHTPMDRFFINYQREKCTVQPIGRNKFARMPYKIAQYLSLSEPDRYTGQAFRLSGQIILKNASHTIVGTINDAIARTYTSRSTIVPSESRIDSGDLPDTEGMVCKSECEEIETESDDSICVENLLKVDNLRLHCTVCDTHLGCAVANEGNIRTHPVLSVTQCENCHLYYNRRTFTKGSNGSEMQCRWCAQGGEVYSCSTCSNVFCRKCILQNLSKNVITEIDKNENWQCFCCAPGAIRHLKSQHWALTNHLRETKIQIRGMKNANELYDLMYDDPTLCCKGKEPLNSRQNPKDKRRRPCDSTNYNGSAPDSKRIRNHSVVSTPNQSVHSGMMSHRASTLPNATIVSQKSVTPSPPVLHQKSSSTTEHPQLSLRPLHSLTSERSASPLKVIDLPLNNSASSSIQNAAFPNNSQLPTLTQGTSSGYQTYNVLVDLDTKEDTFVRLPNGKLIQVRPQTTEPTTKRQADTQQQTSQNKSSTTATSQASPPAAQMKQQSSIQIINLGKPSQQQTKVSQEPMQVINLGKVPIQSAVSQQQSLQPRQQTVSSQPLQRPSYIQQQHQQSNGFPNTPVPQKQYSNTPLGQAQTVLEKEVNSAQEICQQILGKCNALMKSNAYNSAQSFNDVRHLHQHLSYLYTYAADKFVTLKGKCTETMKSLYCAHEETKKLVEEENNYTIVDDDVQVLEPVTECIEIDSDDETEPKETSTEIGKGLTDQQVQSSVSIDDQASSHTIDETDMDEFELTAPPVLGAAEGSYDHYDDKLKGTAVVVLEKDEKIERQLKDVLERQNSENSAGSPLNHDLSIHTNDNITTRRSPSALENQTNAIHGDRDAEETVDVESDHDINLISEDQNAPSNPIEGEHQAKVDKQIEDTQCDNKISHKELDGNAIVDRANDQNEHENETDLLIERM